MPHFQGCRTDWKEHCPGSQVIRLLVPACLPLICCITIDEPLLWMYFPIYPMYKLDYLNFNGLCSFMIQRVFEIKYLKTKKSNAL